MENKQEQVINQEVVNEETQIDEQQDQQKNNVEETNNQDERDKTIEEAKTTIEQLQKELEHSKLITTLAIEGLSEFAGLFELETIEEKVEFLKKVKNDILVANAYVPKDVAKQDEYTQAIEQKDVNKAISFKLSKLFGK